MLPYISENGNLFFKGMKNLFQQVGEKASKFIRHLIYFVENLRKHVAPPWFIHFYIREKLVFLIDCLEFCLFPKG